MDSLSMHFLVATPQLHNSYFERSVILMTDHNETGAMGLVLNKPSTLASEDVFEQLKLPQPKTPHLKLSVGGPVATEQGFILHSNEKTDWTSTISLSDHLSMTTSVDVLKAIANDQGPRFAMLALGYSGWGAGQLEQEMQDNAWLSFPFDSDIVVNTPQTNMLNTLTQANGIDYDRLVNAVGHA